jgi:hypothetical protein
MYQNYILLTLMGYRYFTTDIYHLAHSQSWLAGQTLSGYDILLLLALVLFPIPR